MAHCQFSIYLHLLWQMLSNLILALLFYRNRLALLCYVVIIRIISPINSPWPFLSGRLRESFDDCKPKLYPISLNRTLTSSKNFIFDWNILQVIHIPKGIFFLKVWDNGFQPSWLKAEWINAFSPQKIHNALSWVCAYDIFLTTYGIAFSSFLRLNGKPGAYSRIPPYVLVENLKKNNKEKTTVL